jgi:hypothetical protein
MYCLTLEKNNNNINAFYELMFLYQNHTLCEVVLNFNKKLTTAEMFWRLNEEKQNEEGGQACRKKFGLRPSAKLDQLLGLLPSTDS